MAESATINSGRKTVAAAGTAERLSAVSVTASQVTVQALSGNTTAVSVGGSTVKAAVGATRTGVSLTAGQTYTFSIDDLYDVWVDAITNGEGINYNYTAPG